MCITAEDTCGLAITMLVTIVKQLNGRPADFEFGEYTVPEHDGHSETCFTTALAHLIEEEMLKVTDDDSYRVTLSGNEVACRTMIAHNDIDNDWLPSAFEELRLMYAIASDDEDPRQEEATMGCTTWIANLSSAQAQLMLSQALRHIQCTTNETHRDH